MPEIITIVGTSNSGKTTLMARLIAALKKRGYRIGAIKHTHHPVSPDPETKDSGRHWAAGADPVILAGGGRIAMTQTCPTEDPETLKKYFSDVDLILAEGYKRGPHPKIEAHRQETAAPPLYPMGGAGLFAWASDGPGHPAVPSFGLDDVEAIADLVETRFLKPNTPPRSPRP